MEIIFKKGKLFKKLIEFSKDLIPIGNLTFNKDGISLNSLDSNHVALIFFTINTDAFSKFNIQIDTTLPISFERLCKVFKTYNDSDTMIIKYKNNGDKLLFIFKNTTTKKTATHRIPILNQEPESYDVPDEKRDDTSQVTVTPMTISNITKDCAMFGEYIRITTIKGNDSEVNSIKFSVEDIDGDAEFIYQENKEDIKEIEISEEINCQYTLAYLVRFAKFSSIADSLIITLINNSPICYHYILPIGEIKLFLTPKIE